MRKTILCAATAVALTGLAGLATAGGQQIAAEIGADGKSVVVRTYRCGTPASLAVTGTAEGLVKGERRTVPLKIAPASENAAGPMKAAGAFTVARQWPDEGTWVLTFTVAGERSASALVELAPGPDLRIVSQESTYEKASPKRIDTALRASR